MKNFILKNKLFYRLYQNIIRNKKNEYDFIKFIFEKNKSEINILDVCCGDSYILKYISKYVKNYTGLDNNKGYLKQSRKDYPNFKFYYLDIKKIKSLNTNKINFIFLNGAIHHFNDETIKNLLNYINEKFYFLDSIERQVYRRGSLSIKQRKALNKMYSQFTNKIEKAKKG